MQQFAKLSKRGQLTRLKRMAEVALQEYDLPEPVLTPLGHFENTVFKVQAGGERYSLRICRPGKNTLTGIRSEAQWLAALSHDTDLRVPEPVLTRAGELCREVTVAGVPEARVCVLFRWVAGKALYHDLRPEHLAQAGRLMARIQQHAAHFQPPPGFSREPLNHLPKSVRMLSAPGTLTAADCDYASPSLAALTGQLVSDLYSPEAGAIVAEVLTRVQSVMSKLSPQPDNYGLIHGDLHMDNCLFQRGKVGAIDFDDCGAAYYLYDLTATLLNLTELPQYLELRAALLSGYRELAPLSALDESYLPTFFALRRVELIIWFIEMREQASFRDRWHEDMKFELERLQKFLAEELILTCTSLPHSPASQHQSH